MTSAHQRGTPVHEFAVVGNVIMSMIELLSPKLSPNQRRVYEAVRATSQQDGVPAYLVGGAVRDWLLNCSRIGDLDFVIEGDAIAFAQRMQQQFGGHVQTHDKFRTATWHLAANEAVDTRDELDTSFDFAMARREIYRRPAALPEVSPADMLTDLQRRDFTINAIAMRLSDGQLIDPYDGQGDLQRGLIRILHPQSFVDDPTRLFRAARYGARFNFTLDEATSAAMPASLSHLRQLSGERVKYDLELIFEEAEPERALLQLQAWGVFRALNIPLPSAERIATRFVRIRKVLMEADWPFDTLAMPREDVVHALSWAAITYNTGQLSVSRWVDLIPFRADVRDALVSLGALSTLSSHMLRGDRPSQNSEFLKDFSGLALLMGYLFDPDALKRRCALCEWKDWRWVRPLATGDDLRTLGIAPGPIYAKLLRRLRMAWLDGEVKSLADEQNLLKLLLDEANFPKR